VQTVWKGCEKKELDFNLCGVAKKKDLLPSGQLKIVESRESSALAGATTIEFGQSHQGGHTARGPHIPKVFQKDRVD